MFLLTCLLNFWEKLYCFHFGMTKFIFMIYVCSYITFMTVLMINKLWLWNTLFTHNAWVRGKCLLYTNYFTQFYTPSKATESHENFVCNGYWYNSAAARLSILILRFKTHFMINITMLKFLILDCQSFWW